MGLCDRNIVYRDIHLLDTFFDAGGNNNFLSVATSAFARWLWADFYLPSLGLVYLVRTYRCRFGVVVA